MGRHKGMPAFSSSTVSPFPTEAQFQRQIVDTAHLFGWYTYHTRYSLGSDTGYPDLTMWRPAVVHRQGRVLWAEVKGPRGSLSPEQEEVIRTMREAGCEVNVWKAGVISIEEITEILR